jgi:hypothetical protein
MPDQLALSFDSSPVLPANEVPHLRDEIARAWGLPLGERVEIGFRETFPISFLTGRLELRVDPTYPWDPHQPLELRLAGCDFNTRDIDHWRLL